MYHSWKLLGVVLLFSITTEAARIIRGRALSKDKADALCNGIDHPELCTPIAEKAKKGDVEKLTQLTVKETMDKAEDASKLAANLESKMAKRKKDIDYQLVDTCRSNFESMSDDLKAAMAALEAKGNNKGDPIGNHLSAMSTYLETCVDAYDEAPGVKSPFSKTIRPMQELVDNLFWMSDKLKM